MLQLLRRLPLPWRRPRLPENLCPDLHLVLQEPGLLDSVHGGRLSIRGPACQILPLYEAWLLSEDTRIDNLPSRDHIRYLLSEWDSLEKCILLPVGSKRDLAAMLDRCHIPHSLASRGGDQPPLTAGGPVTIQ